VQVRTANGLVPFQTVIGDAEQVGPSNMWADVDSFSLLSDIVGQRAMRIISCGCGMGGVFGQWKLPGVCWGKV
jgi:hypothetical protein